jgi:hypothetical protein
MVKKSFRRLSPSQSEAGASMPEYVLLAAIFVPLFIIAASALYDATRVRTESTIGVNGLSSPCLPMLDSGGNVIRPDGSDPLCIPFREDICSLGTTHPDYNRLCFCCFP